MEINFYLIRHGESEFNIKKDNTIGGRSANVTLTPKGEEQARKTGKQLMLEGLVFDAAFSSTAIRAKETGRLCFEEMGNEMEILEDELLLEQTQGGWEGMSREVYNRSDVRQALNSDNWNFIPGDKVPGESQHMVAIRMKEWIYNMLNQLSENIDTKPKQNIIVFTHGLAIKFLLAELLDLDRKTAYSDTTVRIDNASITVVTFVDGKIVTPMKMTNFVDHLYET